MTGWTATAQAGDAAGAAAAGLTPAAAWTRCTVADADGPAFLVLVQADCD